MLEHRKQPQTMDSGTSEANKVSIQEIEPKLAENANHPDLLTLEQMEQIRTEIAANQPMISEEISPATLMNDYLTNEISTGFIPGIQYLTKNYRLMRKVRGDGNCFYRALLFGYLEGLLTRYNSAEHKEEAKKEHQRMTEKITNCMSELVEVGYSEFTIETFYDELLELLGILFDQTTDSLWSMFQEGGKADYLTWFFRLLTAGHLKRDPERYLPFVEGLYFDMNSYCAAEVEPMGKECEHVQISALTEYLGISAEIAYLDGRPFDEEKGLSVVKFQEDVASHGGCPFAVHLLYRPGHFDVLYK